MVYPKWLQGHEFDLDPDPRNDPKKTDPYYTGLYRWEEIWKRFRGKEDLIGAEIGVQAGRMASRMLGWESLKEYWCIDTWRSYDHIPRQDTHDKCFHNFLQRASLHPGVVRILTLTSEQAAKNFPDETFDFVFIDADHDYEEVANDILYWGRTVKVGGYLCGHDYGHKHCKGVKQAVDEIFPTRAVIGDDWTWFVRRETKNG